MGIGIERWETPRMMQKVQPGPEVPPEVRLGQRLEHKIADHDGKEQ
jgi:hypothetical protein